MRHAPGARDEAPAEEDPHYDDAGSYVVPAANLVAACSGDYAPEHLLTWIPALERYGTWDSSHEELFVFSGATWSDIARDPLPYVNAQWAEDETKPLGYYVAPWLHGFEFGVEEV